MRLDQIAWDDMYVYIYRFKFIALIDNKQHQIRSNQAVEPLDPDWCKELYRWDILPIQGALGP